VEEDIDKKWMVLKRNFDYFFDLHFQLIKLKKTTGSFLIKCVSFISHGLLAFAPNLIESSFSQRGRIDANI
jgi:hypothetical protein